jgi:glycosyltransferase involved in cell wall biosynthesis
MQGIGLNCHIGELQAIGTNDWQADHFLADEPMSTAARRILLLVPSMHFAGGCERVVHNLSLLLAKQGHSLAIASFDDATSDWHFKGGGERFALGQGVRLPLALRWIEYGLQARKLARLKRKFRPDLTVSNLWRADLISLLSGGSDRKIALAHINVVGNPTNRLMVRLRGLVGAVYRRFDRVVAVSQPLAAELAELYGLGVGRCTAIDNFTDAPAARPCLPADAVRRAVWCGRLVREKNLAGLLEVWAKLSDTLERVQLVVIGDGPLRAELEGRARELGLQLGSDPADPTVQVAFVGAVPSPADYQVSGRVFLLSSLAEGLPMVVLEALALGVPVIAADCPSGGVRAALGEHGGPETGSGALLPIPLPGDHASQEAWLPWLVTALTDDAQLADWRKGALVRAERFSARRAAAEWQGAIEGVLQ